MLHMSTWENAWAVLVILFAGGLIVGKLSEKPRIPDVAAYLMYGILIGPACLNWVGEPSQSQVNQLILNLGAALILFDGGRGVGLSVLKKVWVSVTMMATVGVLVTALVVCVTAHYVLGISWMLSLLIGSVIASTDPATLIPVFKRVPVLPVLRQTVESESAFNDATGSVLVFTLAAASLAGGQIQWGHAGLIFVQNALIGLIIGMTCGLISLFLVSDKAWGIFHEYGSIVLLVTAIGSFEVSSLIGGSGLMAAFVAGVISGNGKTFNWSLAKHTEENVHHFGNAITLIFRMLIFVLLGTQVNFSVVGSYLGPGLVVVAVFMLIARPLTVLASVLIDRKAGWRPREIAFMFWVRETGVIPAALSGMMAAKGVAGASVISAITFMAILLTIVIQASTTDFVAKRLGVIEDEGPLEEI